MLIVCNLFSEVFACFQIKKKSPLKPVKGKTCSSTKKILIHFCATFRLLLVQVCKVEHENGSCHSPRRGT